VIVFDAAKTFMSEGSELALVRCFPSVCDFEVSFGLTEVACKDAAIQGGRNLVLVPETYEIGYFHSDLAARSRRYRNF